MPSEIWNYSLWYRNTSKELSTTLTYDTGDKKSNFSTTLTYATREWVHYRDLKTLTCHVWLVIHAVHGWIRVNGLTDAFVQCHCLHLPSRARTSSSPLKSLTYWCGTCDHPDLQCCDLRPLAPLAGGHPSLCYFIGFRCLASIPSRVFFSRPFPCVLHFEILPPKKTNISPLPQFSPRPFSRFSLFYESSHGETLFSLFFLNAPVPFIPGRDSLSQGKKRATVRTRCQNLWLFNVWIHHPTLQNERNPMVFLVFRLHCFWGSYTQLCLRRSSPSYKKKVDFPRLRTMIITGRPWGACRSFPFVDRTSFEWVAPCMLRRREYNPSTTHSKFMIFTFF